MPEHTWAQTEIAAPPAAIMAVIADLPSYPQWCTGIGSAEVLTTFRNGRPRTVRVVLDAPPVVETHEYEYEWRPREVSWHLTQGGIVSSMHGRYTCLKRSKGITQVTYELTMTLDMPLIGTLRRRAERHIVGTALRGLKERVESRP
ncbi:MAG: SRPBCC family protein [Candidatus Nanopelagicales bacterium]|nr:SRPBCC family protein [Candidatus Nanopelagicales bacterium]MDZ4249778.1 SRPBCC family protein [Candidatus Nanopelagicales bacterium]MDZ7578794.1 SRPBCC family protein [Candidatus Nanopelagicales bacterium]